MTFIEPLTRNDLTLITKTLQSGEEDSVIVLRDAWMNCNIVPHGAMNLPRDKQFAAWARSEGLSCSYDGEKKLFTLTLNTAPAPEPPTVPARPVADLERLRRAVAAFDAAEAELNATQRFFDETSAEVRDFALQGNLRSEKAVTKMLVKQLQASLLPARVAQCSAAIESAEAEVAAETKPASKKLLSLYSALECGHAEIAAKSLIPFVESVKEARQTGMKSKQAAAIRGRRFQFEIFERMNDTVAVARVVLEQWPALEAEIAEVEKQLGEGGIPSLAEMTAI